MNHVEEWRDINGYEGLYQVSNLGRVRSLDRWRKNGQNGYIQKGKILTSKVDTNGYFRVSILKNGAYKKASIHRLIAETFMPNPKGYPVINHIDGNKTNNDIKNLEWCTYSMNSKHALEIGLANPPKGEKHWRYGKRPTEEQIRRFVERNKNNRRYGHKLSNEHKEKISKALAGDKNPIARKVVCITTNKIFKTIKEASEYYNCARTHISSNCKGKRSYCGKLEDGTKLEWMYYKDFLNERCVTNE